MSDVEVIRKKLNVIANHFETTEETMLDFLEGFTNNEMENYMVKGKDGLAEVKTLFTKYKETQDE